MFGHEHYAEDLENLACAGVPINDPISGRMLGVVDLTCWRKDAESLLLTLAKNTAEQIQQALLSNASLREFEVLQAYRQTCRRTTGIVFAVTNDAVMLNDHARADLDPRDQATLLARAAEAGTTLAAGRRRSLVVALPSGAQARMYCQQVGYESEPAGLVAHVKVDQTDDYLPQRQSPPSRMVLPGLVGDAPLWRRACHQVEASLASGTWLALEGEPGVGKLSLLRAVQLRRQPPRRSTVLDAVDAADGRAWIESVRTALTDADTVVLTHVDALDGRTLRSLGAALEQARRDRSGDQLWVAVTLRSAGAQPELGRLLSFFPATVSVPPLRLRLEDLPSLVAFLLAKLAHNGHVTCSSEATRLLMRSSWPGNVAQLQQLLNQVLQHRRAGMISADDLPPEMHAISRRILSPMETLERDAIVRSLADTGGNKAQAARALGMSRATIYRKIHEFGIIT